MRGQGRAKRIGAVAGAGALALAWVLVGCDSVMEAMGESLPTGRAEPCPEGGVRLAEGEGNAAMGLRVADFQLVNCGSAAYVLEGYPEIRLLDSEDRPLQVDIGHGTNGVTSPAAGGDAPPRRVTLQPGQAGTTGLLWRNLVTDSTVPAAEGQVLDSSPSRARPG
ncbi:DUF4232 domain-containing protein [Streptomyces avidinii]|uniref:DUF4232 domain-containing protein n=1 Tax=Streptomyces avidinii TaxID=1895 RepID=A0ABS4LFL9_STRAV|nr:DUF4232 domain-containing protein [Streptomyces avidinii]MBP2040896.1 hypothetical protein [Streptomyces avidinii]GGZ06088.1 hypothetical protein GCM10010343_34970 [Streptomyces avidinii]